SRASWLQTTIAHPLVKSLMPFPIIAALAYPMWKVFGPTWRQIEREARSERIAAGDELDLRPAVCLVLSAGILTIQEYYGGRTVYEQVLRPELTALDASGWSWLKVAKYDQLYSYLWWSAARVIGYVLVPVLVWKLCFRKDRILDYGLHVEGFFKHLWIYGVMLAIVIPVMLIVAQQPDFGNYYPFYKL